MADTEHLFGNPMYRPRGGCWLMWIDTWDSCPAQGTAKKRSSTEGPEALGPGRDHRTAHHHKGQSW
eukprot:1993194-Karenia_brevis.AAC.1